MPTADVPRIARLIRGIRIAIVTSRTKDGKLHGRPMATQESDFDGDLWFFTNRASFTAQEVAESPDVAVAYADTGENRYVSIAGRASIVDDRAKIQELWSEHAKAWFPDGPDDPSLVLLKVDPQVAWFWEGPTNKAVLAYKIIKAIAKGEKADKAMGESGTVKM